MFATRMASFAPNKVTARGRYDAPSRTYTLLLEQTLLARDLELLVDVPEFEQQRRIARLDHRNGTGKMQTRLAADADLELLLGVRRAIRQRFVDRLKQCGRLAEKRAC